MTPDATIGREQSGRRPAVVVAGQRYLQIIDTMALIVPVTSTDRGWPNHIPIADLPGPSWAMTEQVRAVSRSRLHGHLGQMDDDALEHVRHWLRKFLDL